MTKITKMPILIAGTAILSFAGFATASYAHPKKHEDMSQTQQTTSHSDHKDMKMKDEHKPKMDMSKMDMSKISEKCQTVLKTMNDHDMKNTEGHDMEKMQAKTAKHKECMAEMKQAMPHKH